ncbi:hypothetical protein PHYSODRAFT_320227 [Phytophthora sojae]|uniref:P-type ATPase C-terminal domain-containing protein n=1 Tax=Phytophthora sojae (strain P6497) TaxID=1094619 RepID=G5AHM4_PHYSP|nr:hypothetical protein PHYSODRAFT_320227 [Phytophthora sojae]EGZ04945.1 hypothetical protein PHYSODRAFT_320227 [Phytophthora sojae]|eukprot:XP_009539575.1 hypothetical protein PHYSODRAFT_320227 [Phytophthora sojae]
MDWIYGLVVNTGLDTKIMQSATATWPKWSSIIETVNKINLAVPAAVLPVHHRYDRARDLDQLQHRGELIPYVNFEDPRLFNILERPINDDTPNREAEFFLHLSLCQTVIPEMVEGSSEVRFSVSSTDEQALVSEANTPNGGLTKGDDNTIYPMLAKGKSDPEMIKDTMLETFGDDGLRTLTITQRRVDEKEYLNWSARFKEANSSLEEIDKRKNGLPNETDKLMTGIERDLELLGATAIEDKLQSNVPGCSANLIRAGMRVWATSRRLPSTPVNSWTMNDMQQFIFSCDLYPTKDTILSHLTDANAQCLELTLADDRCQKEFLSLAMACEAVVCCRVSPIDGANDVAMIQRAHVGFGISGQEGMQALLLHHGRSILAGYMLYKNIVTVLAQYFYTFCAGSSGQKFYGELGFHICYTSLPIIVLGVFDYDVPLEVSRHFRELYLVGPRMEMFNNYTFFKWICSAVYESAVIFVFVVYAFNENLSNPGSAPMVQYGLLAFTMVVLVANSKLCLLQMSWGVYGAVCWFVGVIAYLPLTPIISSF